jgi:hypothetical protein
MGTTSSGRGYDHLPAHRQRIYKQDRCTDFDDLIAQASAHGRPVTLTCWPADGRPLADEQDCWDLINKLRNSRPGRQWTIRRGQPDGLGPQLRGGRWVAKIQVLPKDQGREYIAARLERGELIPFSPFAERARGKYICPRLAGGCGHRRSKAPGWLCLDCQAAGAARNSVDAARQAAEQARRAWGEGWDDVTNWRVDHALTPPRTPRERAARPVAEQARQHISLEQRIRQRTGQRLSWEERPPSRLPATGATGKLREAPRVIKDHMQAAQDQAEAAAVDGPPGEKIRQMLDQWKSGRWT